MTVDRMDIMNVPTWCKKKVYPDIDYGSPSAIGQSLIGDYRTCSETCVIDKCSSCLQDECWEFIRFYLRIDYCRCYCLSIFIKRRSCIFSGKKCSAKSIL